MQIEYRPAENKKYLTESEVADALSNSDWIMIRVPGKDGGLSTLVRVSRVIVDGTSTVVEIQP